MARIAGVDLPKEKRVSVLRDLATRIFSQRDKSIIP